MISNSFPQSLIRIFLPIIIGSLNGFLEAKCKNAQPDAIKGLPGMEFDINFKHYSGFLNATENNLLHYWFVTSQQNPESDPLVFWLNGGPGCSSLVGLLKEMGPYLVNDDGETLRENEFAWNRIASIVYIESPAGVGFSLNTEGNVSTNDDEVAEENYTALKSFFEKYPEYKSNPLYISGESYAGIYVPMLAVAILNGQKEFPLNLKGILIGNALLNLTLDVQTAFEYGYGHGFVAERDWQTFVSGCCPNGCIEHCNIFNLNNLTCIRMARSILNDLWNGTLNPYNVYGECEDRIFENPSPGNQGIAIVSCSNYTAITNYLNTPKVQKALNVAARNINWEDCSDAVESGFTRKHSTVTQFIRQLLNERIATLLYYGDEDLVCNFLMGQRFSEQLGLEIKSPKKAWFLDDQFCGHDTVYDGLTYTTVHGAGHYVPSMRRKQAFYIFSQFLSNKPF